MIMSTMQLLLPLVLVYYICASLVSSKEILIKSDHTSLTQCNLTIPVTDLPLQNHTTFHLDETVNQFKNINDNITIASVTQPDLINLWKRFPLSITANVSGLSERCQRSTREYLKGIQDQELWALKMLDATAKLPSGILSGNVNQFGDYDECLSVQEAQYCLAEIDLEPVWKKSYSSYRNLVHSHFSFRGSFNDPQHRVPDFAIIKWGICFTSQCSPEDLQRSLEENLGVVARVQPSLCRKSVEIAAAWTFGDYFARLFFALLLLAVTISSLAVHYNKAPFLSSSESKLVRILLAFSVQNNWKELINAEEKDCNNAIVKDDNNNYCNSNKAKDFISNNQDGEIRAVHGIRALSAIGLLMCHKSVALMYNPYINRTATMENFGMAWTVIARTAIVYTDSFMLLSGLLTTNSLLKDIERHGSLKFKDKLVTRLFRITPNIVALILFCTYILPNISSGPLWPTVIQQHSDLCKQHMWRNLLYIHNHFGFENMCLTHTHQVGIDMQLFLFTPIIIYLWWINKKLGVYTAAIIAVLSTILRYWVTVQHNLSHMIYFGIPVKQMFDTANLSYILPSHRATIYVTGVLLAYILKRYNSDLSKLRATLWWIVALSFGAFSMIGPFHMARLGYVYNNTDAAIFGAFSPIWWGVCLSWVIFASNRGYAGWFGDFLSWKGFRLFTKIAYAFYLVQFPVIFYNIGIQKNADEFRPNILLHYSETSVIIFFSIILTLCVEMPFQKVKQVLFDAPYQRRDTKISQNNIHKTTKTGHIKHQ